MGQPITFVDMWEIRQPKELYFLGIRIQQPWTNLFLLEDILNKNQDIKNIVELGTGKGALALFFGLHMKDRGRVLTIDITDNLDYRTSLLRHNLPITFLHADILDPQTQVNVQKFMKKRQSPIRSLVFCDAGEKEIRPRQLMDYAKLLKPGDLILQHDYGNSLSVENVEKVRKVVPLEYFRQVDFDNLKTFTVCLQRCVDT